MKTILTITGDAGTGKDTIARWLADHEGWNIVISYTTRPMREGEVNGREHNFLTPPSFIGRDNIRNCLAYTVYGGYEYWTTWDQIADDRPTLYIIDENGLLDLLEARAATGKFELITMHVTADEEVRLSRGVTRERMERDATRDKSLKYFRYDFEVKNNKSMKALKHALADIAKEITSK